MTGLKHRMNYMKEHYMNYHMQIKQQAEKKSDQTPLVERFSKMVEDEEGRQEFKVRHDLEFYQAAPNIPGLLEPSAKRLRQGHGNYGGEALYQPYGSTAEFESELDTFLMRTTGNQIGGMGLLLKSLMELLNDGMPLETEEEAGMALKVSNSLTHALLDYRLKSVPANMRGGLDDIESPAHGRMGGGPGRNPGNFRGGHDRNFRGGRDGQGGNFRGGRDGNFRGGQDRGNFDQPRERGSDDVGMNFLTDVLKNIRENEQEQGGFAGNQGQGQGGYGGGQGGFGGGQGGYGGGRRQGFGYSYGDRY